MIIPYSTITAYAKKIEKRNLKNFKHSLTWVSMLNNAPKIDCIYQPEKTVKVSPTWRREFDQFEVQS